MLLITLSLFKCSFAKITNSLSRRSINNVTGKRFIELLSVDSTNNYAMRQVQKELARNGDAYFAFEQTAGKGQFNKQWLSSKRENIILSIVMKTDELPVNQQFILNMIVALSALKLFNKYAGEQAKIKWPNDIFWRDRKAAGILIENVIRGSKWQYAVIGIGMNINQVNFTDGLKKPVSLKQITGKTYNVVDLAKELCEILDKDVAGLLAENNGKILEDYNSELYKLDANVSFKNNADSFEGIIKRVNASGELIVEINHEERSFKTGEIEWMND